MEDEPDYDEHFVPLDHTLEISVTHEHMESHQIQYGCDLHDDKGNGNYNLGYGLISFFGQFPLLDEIVQLIDRPIEVKADTQQQAQ